jgi:gallate dioxygenase
VQQWLAEKKPDVLLVVYNDHVTSFFFDHYSAFALGIGESYKAADEGGGPRNLPPVAGHAALARHLGQSLMADEFDMSFFQDKPLDHGCFSPLSMLWRTRTAGPARSCRCRWACCSSRCRRRAAATSWARPAPRHRKLSGRPERGAGRHRRPVAPGAWRARGLQQHAVGSPVPRPVRERSGGALNMTHAELAPRRLESAEVIMWMDLARAMPAGSIACIASTTCRR